MKKSDMSRRITIRDIARNAGVHHTTVSRALKNDPRISSRRREQIQALAEEMGYRPDPMLTSLNAYRSGKQKSQFQAALGWITNYPTRSEWHAAEKIGYFAGAKKQAARLGYKLDEFWLNEEGMTAQRTTDILSARNIQGLIFIPQPRAHTQIQLNWEQFSAISISHTLSQPPLHTITNHHYRSMAQLMRHIKELGYRRPGFACKPQTNEAVDRDWAAAFWAYYPGDIGAFIPPLISRKWDQKIFHQWLKTYSPDVVISPHRQVALWLKKCGLTIPQDIGFAVTACHNDPGEFTGIDENNELVGKTAVNLVVDMVHRGETGIPEIPQTTLIAGTIIAGSTLTLQHR